MPEEPARHYNALAAAEPAAIGATGLSALIAYGNALVTGIGHGVHLETGVSVGIGSATAFACGIMALHYADRASGNF